MSCFWGWHRGVEGSHQSECGQAVLRQHRNCLRCCLQLPLTWQYHPKSQSPPERLLCLNNKEVPIPKNISPHVLPQAALIFPFRPWVVCGVWACHLLPVCPQLYHWFGCKTEEKDYNWLSVSNFFMPDGSVQNFYSPVFFRCHLFILITVLIFTRIYGLLAATKIKS